MLEFSVMLLFLVAVVAVGTPYERALSKATPVSNLGRFLERYVGRCDDLAREFQGGCRKKAQGVRRSERGKLRVVEVESLRDILRLAEWNDRKSSYLMHLTPIFGEHGLALTLGKPRRLNVRGQPVLRNHPIWVPSSEHNDYELKRALSRGGVRLELLFRPRDVWALKKRKRIVRGLSADLVGYRLLPERGNKPLAEKLVK